MKMFQKVLCLTLALCLIAGLAPPLTAEAAQTDREIVETVKAALSLPAKTSVDLTLPETGGDGTVILWRSSDESILRADGVLGGADGRVKLTATIFKDSASATRDFFVEVGALANGLTAFDYGDVQLTAGWFKDLETWHLDDMDSISADAVLWTFRNCANLYYGQTYNAGSDRFTGWATVGYWNGHMEGHYISALAQLIGVYHRQADIDKLNAIIAGLADIQQSMIATEDNGYGQAGSPRPEDFYTEAGYISGFPEFHMNKFERDTTGVPTGETKATSSVPWYLLAKVLAGLIDAYRYGGNEQALDVAKNFGNWVVWRMGRLTEAQRLTILNTEYGSMGEALLNLWTLTGDGAYLTGAGYFEQRAALTDALATGIDNLNAKHANTYLAKIATTAQQYLLTGDDYYGRAAGNFWEFAVGSGGRAYVNGGVSNAEVFSSAGSLSGTLNARNAETCNVYNLLKISRSLFQATADVKYLDYYEKALFNQIAASIANNGAHVFHSYFQVLGQNRTGTFLTSVSSNGAQNQSGSSYGTSQYCAWCCNGTGVENFSKLTEGIYYHDSDKLYVSQYIASTLSWPEKGLALTQDTDYPYEDETTF
ncbi:MAG: glycoside hydrolase family 127 protein, partial [Oscillospiraceae bacterium]|nr:glycoside hydrolase family 127 protein [Oscillospiraceae bacterium]